MRRVAAGSIDPSGRTAQPPIPGLTAQGYWLDDQENFTQEIRLQSNDSSARLSWVVGAFYSHAKQRARQFIDGSQFDRILEYLAGFPISVEEYFGSPLVDGFAYITDDRTKDEQLAAFGQLDYKLTDRLTVTGGLRVSYTKFDFVSSTDGPYFGKSSVPGSTSQTPVTPKFGISYETDGDGLLYANISKGFRVGGAQRPAPVTCAGDLAALGIDQIPQTYGSDSVWAYEAGAKGTFFDRKVQAEASIFQLDWSNIQRSVSLGQCNLSYIDNLGSVLKTNRRGSPLSINGLEQIVASAKARAGLERAAGAGADPWGVGKLHQCEVCGRCTCRTAELHCSRRRHLGYSPLDGLSQRAARLPAGFRRGLYSRRLQL